MFDSDSAPDQTDVVIGQETPEWEIKLTEDVRDKRGSLSRLRSFISAARSKIDWARKEIGVIIDTSPLDRSTALATQAEQVLDQLNPNHAGLLMHEAREGLRQHLSACCHSLMVQAATTYGLMEAAEQASMLMSVPYPDYLDVMQKLVQAIKKARMQQITG